jgi:ketosteroid isomerase-like protein
MAKVTLCATLLLALTITVLAESPMEESDDVKQIRQSIDNFIIAYKAGNLDGILSYYSEDLIKMRQGSQPETKTQTADRVREVFRSYKTDIRVTVDEIVVSADLAYSRGAFEVTLVPKSGGETVQILRHYLEVWRKEAGTWRVLRTMDN